MGTASTMHSLAKRWACSCRVSASIPGALSRARQIGYATGKRIVDMVHEDLRPPDHDKEAFHNASWSIPPSAADQCTITSPPSRSHGRGCAAQEWQTVGHKVR